MHFSSALVPLLAAWSVQAETYVIEAGNLYFSPATVNASQGDVLEFRFLPNNHSVVMGDFNKPCQPASTGGFYSGFLPVESGESSQVFRVTINNTDPIVYYCSQNASSRNHCRGGMYGFVNQQDQGAIQLYATAANQSSINISPEGQVYGGMLVASANTTTSPSATATQSGGASSTNTGPPQDNGGTGVKASGLLAIAVALMMV